MNVLYHLLLSIISVSFLRFKTDNPDTSPPGSVSISNAIACNECPLFRIPKWRNDDACHESSIGSEHGDVLFRSITISIGD